MFLKFTTKAETLKLLEKRLNNAQVLPQFCFTVEQWAKNQSIANFRNVPDWVYGEVIVRSSGLSEDSITESLAGHFTSIANVKGLDDLNGAIHQVVQSFSDKTSGNQVFIQPMLKNVLVSGVAFTRDPSNHGHYYIINYDDITGKTDTVTDGSTNQLKTFYCAKYFDGNECGWKSRLFALLYELEHIFQQDNLDIEFAVDNDHKLFLLQVRPLILREEFEINVQQHKKSLTNIQSRFLQLSAPHPYLFGKRSVFGIMPDWNPAEIIGIRPRPLAFSLYKELITDNIWAYQRDNYGYRNLRSFPLLINFEGLPYIDVRVSFNSFIPKGIDDDLAEKLVNHYIEQLVESPDCHDKVEFEIIYSCYTLDLPQRLEKLKKYGFDSGECDAIANSLRELTNHIIHEKNGLWKKDIEKLSELESRQNAIINSELQPLEQIYWLIEDCKRYGTLPFAGLARAGFIAVQILKSLVATSILSETDYQDFINSLNTVSSSLALDLSRLDKSKFMAKYGHLRPGTYDILSPSYAEAPEKYFSWPFANGEIEKTKGEDFKLGLSKLNRLQNLLREHGLEHNVLSLFNFIKSAIEGREYAKFLFTKSLSQALNLITQIGKKYQYTKEDLSYLDISEIKKLYSCSKDINEVLKKSITNGKNAFKITQAINLPPLITREEDIFSFELPQNKPNFITLKSVTAEVVDEKVSKEKLAGNILVIPSADPGYDWIFSHGIAGFITQYGGVNSHMAIRAGEMGIPAVIGAGESLYKQWSKSKILEIDCTNKKVNIVR